MFAALGFPTPSDNLPRFLLTVIVLGIVCRDKSRNLTAKCEVLMVAMVLFYCAYCL